MANRPKDGWIGSFSVKILEAFRTHSKAQQILGAFPIHYKAQKITSSKRWGNEKNKSVYYTRVDASGIRTLWLIIQLIVSMIL